MFKDLNKKEGYFQLIAAGEPYRLLFPLGAFIGILGVLMWPLFVWHFMKTYPGATHPRVMIEGFLTCFVAGFLGTALPRLLDVPRVTLGETLGVAGTISGITALHYSVRTLAGDELFFLLFLVLVVALAFRTMDANPSHGALRLRGTGLDCGRDYLGGGDSAGGAKWARRQSKNHSRSVSVLNFRSASSAFSFLPVF